MAPAIVLAKFAARQINHVDIIFVNKKLKKFLTKTFMQHVLCSMS